ncbi:unnamed protein product [Rotaria socialis]|uniref:Uncharacterized protein n=1 Tax=Rotaria socialis TaxID=392032 RepID=A0A817P8J7_9BILA|nr:unnamed protein product [Rotaria socialis]CAF3261195.1 unnamed protein product [Rotaria socialis]CAF3646173.1 unnamed protein product [Rotaria socialis]CAF4099865.1 unnamed protein product [Rotaria socialis]CAF4213705.1 unnamed protein product [Rotaria socialis]
MFRVLISSIRATANMLLVHHQNLPSDQSSTSKWHKFRNIFFSTISSLGISFIRSLTETDTLYECVNTYLAHSATNRNTVDPRKRNNSGVSRLSRPNFRRRSCRSSGIIRIVKPKIHIHIH